MERPAERVLRMEEGQRCFQTAGLRLAVPLPAYDILVDGLCA